jgi:hypothetical protein
MKPELPSATVTFLFTDVEGSTKLLHELGAEAYYATAALVSPSGSEPQALSLHDLGEHRLKDIDLSAWGRLLPAAEDDLEHQPASSGEFLRRQGPGA